MRYQQKFQYVFDRLSASYALYRKFFVQVWWLGMVIAITNTLLNNFMSLKHPSKFEIFLMSSSVLLATLLSVFLSLVMFFKAEGCRNKSPSQWSILSRKEVLSRYYRAFIVFTLTMLWCMLGFILGILPGIILFVFLVFCFPWIVLKNESAWGAIKKSVLLVKGYWFKTFLLYFIPFFLTLVFFILVNIVFGLLDMETPVLANVILEILVGVFILPYYVATTVEQFEFLRAEKKDSL